MNIVLMIFGSIFLTLIFVLVAFLLLFYIWVQRIQRLHDELQKGGNDNIELPDSLVVFSNFPVLGNFFKRQLALMKDGMDYFNNSIPQILADWDSQELVKISTRQFLDSLETGEPEKSFKSHFHNLGKLKDYKGIRNVEGNDYLAEASFEKGLAQFQVQLLQQDNQFLINAFKVNYLFKLDSQDS